MADVEYRNRVDVKWHRDFDSSLVQSLVGVSSLVGAELTIGGIEVLTATCNAVASAQAGQLVTGIAEILGSSVTTTSTTAATLILGITEELSSSISIQSDVIGFINLGIAVDLTSTCAVTTEVDATIELGVQELLASSSTLASVVGVTLTVGKTEFVTGPAAANSTTSGLLSLGVVEILGSSAVTTSTIDAVLTLGITEVLTSTSNVNTTTIGILTLGVSTSLSATDNVITTVTGLLSLGIVEILASSSTNTSTTDATLELGQSEELSNSTLINSSVTDSNLILGITEVLTSTCTVTSTVTGLLLAGITEVLSATDNITTEVDAALTIGEFVVLSSSITAQSSISAFLILGITETLESTVNIVSTIPAATLVLGHVEILASTGPITTEVDATISFGQAESFAHTLTSGGGIDEDTTFLFHANGGDQSSNQHVFESKAGWSNPTSNFLDDSISVFGGAAIKFDGYGYLETPDHTDWTLGSDEFVIDFRVQFSSITGDRQLITHYDSGGNNRGWRVMWSNNNNLYFNYSTTGSDSNSITWSWTPSLNTWYHVAIVRSGNTLYCYIDGTRQGSGDSLSATVYNADAPLALGTRFDNGTAGQMHQGYLDEVRISIGTDRGWTGSAITVPTSPYTSDNDTALLLHFDAEATDTNRLLTMGDDQGVFINPANGKFNGSFYFDGSGGHLFAPLSDGWAFDTGDFVVDFWMYYSGGYQPIIGNGYNTDNYWHIRTTGDNYLTVSTGNASQISTSPNTVPTGEWVHIAVVRSSGTMYLLINGEVKGSGASTHNYNASAILYMAKRPAASEYMTGYLDEIRISKGTDRGWSSGFTVPIEEYSEVTSNPFVVSNIAAILTIGHVELLATTTAVVSNVSNASLVLGEAASLSGTTSSTSSTSGFMILGITETLSSAKNITTNVNGNLSSGILETLSATRGVVSTVSGVLEIGIATDLSATCAVISNTYANITLGVATSLSGTCSFISLVSPSELSLGIVEILASTGPITSTVTDTTLTIGITEVLTTTPGITSEVDAFLDLGVSEGLSATTNAVVTTSAAIALGIVEILASSASNASVTVGSLQLGQGEDLSSPCAVTTTTSGLLSIGIVEILASTSISAAVATANLGFGVSEPMTHTLYSDVITGGNDAYTKLLLHLDADDGNTGHITKNVGGNIVLDSANKKFGSGSASFNGSSSLGVPSHSDFNFGSGNFVLDAWVKASSGSTKAIMGREAGAVSDAWHLKLKADNSLQFAVYVSGSWDFIFNPTGTTVPSNTWSHVALVRSGNTWNMFIDGTRVGQTTSSITIPTMTSDFQIGKDYGDPNFDGNIDELRVSVGTDRGWTGTSFSTPTVPWTSDSYTKLLLHMNADDSTSNHNVTMYGDPHFTPNVEKWNGSFSFDGTGDHLRIPTSTDFDITGQNDYWTLDFWVYALSSASNQHLFSIGSGVSGFIVQIDTTGGYLQVIGGDGSGFELNIKDTVAIPTSQWVHVAVVNNGGTVNLYKNGTSVGVPDTLTKDLTFSSNNVTIGIHASDYSSAPFQGYLDEIRLSNGIARWTTNFNTALPSTPYNDLQEQQVSSWLAQSAVTGVMTVGVIEVLTAECVCWTSISGPLSTGIVEILASSSTTASVVDADLHLGEPVDFTSPCAVVSNVTDTTLTLGTIELLASTVGYGNGVQFTSTVSGLLSVGLVEILAATSVYASVVNAELTIGIDEILTSTPLTQSTISSVLTLGITETLSATNGIISSVSADLTLGADVIFNSTTLIQSSVSDATLTLGITEVLSTTNNIQSSTSATLVLGLNEVLTATATITTEADATLILGIASPLTATATITTEADATITLGISEPLSSTVPCQSTVDGGPLLAGGGEELSCHAQAISNVSAALTLGISTTLSGTTNVVSLTVAFINLGVSEPLTATSTLAASVTGGMILGVDTVVSGSTLVQSTVAGNLFIGAFEIITGSSTITSVTSALLSLGIVEVLGSTGAITSSVDAALTLGIVETLSSTTNSVSTVTSSLTIGVATALTGTSVVVSVTAGSIATGIVEVLGSTSITASVVDAVLTLGITEELTHSVSGVGNDAYTKLLLHMDDTALSDSSGSAHSVTKNNQVDRSGAEAKFGGYSAIFDGNADYLTIPDSTDFEFGSDDFVIDFWFKRANVPTGVERVVEFRNVTSAYKRCSVGMDSSGIYFVATTSGTTWDVSMAAYINDNNWHHHAIVRSGSSWYLFQDGIFQMGDTQSGSLVTDTPTTIAIGSNNQATESLDGYLDEFRISKGTDRGWTSNFSVPTSAYSAEEFITSSVSADLTLGVDVIFTGTSTVVSSATCGVLATGVVEVLGSSNTTTTAAIAQLQLGVTEPVSASISVTSVVTDASLIIGVQELLASTAITTAVIGGVLTLGVGYYISGTATCVSLVEAAMDFGVTELLGSAIATVSYTVAELDTGVSEIMGSAIVANSVADAWLYKGVEEILGGSVGVVSVTASSLMEISMAMTNEGNHARVRHNISRFVGGNISPTPEVE